MNTKVLLLGAVVTAFAFTSFAAEPLLSPRAAGNQIKTANSSFAAPAATVAYVSSTSALLSPRAQGNAIKVVQGTDTTANPILACRTTMAGTPRAVTECTSHTTMPGCATVSIK